MKTKNIFKAGKNNIGYVSSAFNEYFGDLECGEDGVNGGLTAKTLEKSMNDDEILKELNPAPVTISELLAFMKNADKSVWHICYIKDSNDVLRAVSVRWDDGGWRVYAYSVEHPDRWSAGGQVFSRNFSNPSTLSTQSLSPSASLTLESALKMVVDAGYIIYKKL